MTDKAAKVPQTGDIGYKIDIIGRNVYVTEAMKKYAMEKLSKIDRFHNHIFTIHVKMDIQRLEHSVDIVIHFNHFRMKVSAHSTDMYVSIDKAIHKLQTQIRRWKDRIQDHHNKSVSMIDMQVNVLQRPYDELEEINAQIEAANLGEQISDYRPPRIIGTESRPLKTLTVDEAVMKMDLSGDHFLLFRSEDDRKLKLIYRRSDGHFGMIVLEGH